MEKELLEKVHLVQLEIAREVKRVCEENDIHYFLAAGSFLGAVRHQGFIPWDDDLDIGMLRGDYEKFCRIAPKKLGSQYTFQNWYTDPNYSVPMGKVLKRNTLYLENKKSRAVQENGIYVDIFAYDNVPEDPFDQESLTRRLTSIYRTMLMKSGYAPWRDGDRILWHKRIGYLYYQIKALFVTQKELAKAYDALAEATPESKLVCHRGSRSTPIYFSSKTVEKLADYTFEGETFKGPRNYDAYLKAFYGDYMQLPPEEERENRHQIVKVSFDTEAENG